MISISSICTLHRPTRDITHARSGLDPFGSHTSWQMFVYMLQRIKTGCDLVLEEAHNHIFLVSRQPGLILVNYIYPRIFLFQRWELGPLIPEPECWTSDSLCSQTPWWWNSVTKHVGVILTMNCVLGCVLYSISWSAFVGQYIEEFFVVTLYGTLQVPQI